MVEFHPLADAFPLIEGQDFEDLVSDIDKNGQLHPIVRFEGKILDGRNRYKACQRLGIKAHMTEYFGADPVGYVVSENMRRRHLTPAQLAVAAERLATAMEGRPRKTSPAGANGDAPKPTTIDDAAKLTGASPTAISRVRTVRKRGTEEVVKAMDEGKITPTAADNLAKLPKARQEEIMASTDPEKLAAVATATAKAEAPGGPGRGGVGPKVLMTRHMALPDVIMVQKLADDWSEHADVIPELDADALKKFREELMKSRTAITRLLGVIDKATGSKTPRARVSKTAASTKAAAGTNRNQATADKAPAKTAAKKAAPSAAKGKAATTAGAAKKAAPSKAADKAPAMPGARKTSTGTTLAVAKADSKTDSKS